MCVYQHFIQIPSGTGGIYGHLFHIRVLYGTGRCTPTALLYASLLRPYSRTICFHS
jgi:hypothetical protein